MTATALESQLIVGATLFILGVIGFLTRRNLILIMLSAELMLHGVSINLTAFSRYLSLYQRRKSLDIFLWGKLGEDDLPVFSGSPAPPITVTVDPNVDLPHLTPAGRMPKTQPGPQTKT
jgi:NADH-quinone oxidoreductase subunit K